VIRTLLEGTTHNYSERLARAPSAAPPHAVQRAAAFMRENVFQTLTVEDIAQAAGCSARALAAAFRTERGQTVTSALRDLRLEAAREAFKAGDPALTIREVAARLNFSNPGRFAAFYRERFGEMPLQTQSGRVSSISFRSIEPLPELRG
jgi:transcriptional regulator GlxA family with amidase domain